MNVIGCHRIIEDGQTEAFPGFEDPMQVTATVTHLEFSGDSPRCYLHQRLERSAAVERLEQLERTDPVVNGAKR